MTENGNIDKGGTICIIKDILMRIVVEIETEKCILER